jgi:uncharacterized protein YeeX (DUF496 family)
MNIRKEIRDERDDIFTIFTTEKGLNEEKTEIIDIEKIVRENVTKVMLLEETDALQSQINELEVKKEELNVMITMIDLEEGIENA